MAAPPARGSVPRVPPEGRAGSRRTQAGSRILSTVARLFLTPGEPAGIGPDLTIRLAQEPTPGAQIVAVADPALLEQRARQLNLPLRTRPFQASAPRRPQQPGELEVLPVALDAPVQAGQLDPRNSGYVLNTLRAAVRAVLDEQGEALVTGPVHKGVINDAGVPFSGHTEFLAEITGAPLPVMMLAAKDLRVALVTTHLPLRAVADAITAERLESTLHVLHHDLCLRFRIANPRILVAGLNPHAGEGGYLGREEIEIIAPTLERLREEGLRLTGPLPADTLFTPRYLRDADAVLTMYHDQGLPVLKHYGFGDAVNITLGLPIVRTSVDHGTALELAGTGQAEVGSLRAAVNLAAQLAQGAA